MNRTATGPAPMAGSGARPSRRILVASFVVVATILGAVVVLNTGGLRDRLLGKVRPPRIESLAVLPLENLSGDPDQEAFTNGMTEALITELSKVKSIRKVISRTSVMQYKGVRKPIRQIASELGVDALIEGSALRAGDRVRITVQVIDGASDAHLWADSFEREYRDILALHSEVARAIARGVNAALSPAEVQGISAAATVNPEAYDFYLRGRDYYMRGSRKEDHKVAIEMYEKATQLDPGVAQAHAALSEVHSVQWWLYYDRTQQRVSMARRAAERALQLGPDLPESHRALAFLYYWCYLDYEKALREFAVVRRTVPNDALTLWGIALILRRQGKVEESLSYLEAAIGVNPLSSELVLHAAYNCLMMRDLKGALRYLDTAIRLSPDTPLYSSRVQALLRVGGDIAGAKTVLESAPHSGPGNTPSVSYSRVLLDLYSGTVREAIPRLRSESWDALEGRARYVPRPLLLAQLYRETGDVQLARSSYEVAAAMAAEKIRQQPEEPFYHSTLGIAYAGLDRKEDAIREGKAGAELQRVSKDAIDGVFQLEELARIYAMVGEDDEAIRLLENLMSIPGDLGAGALRLDPVWAPLRASARFQALIHRYSP